jgi:SAM-dependent methyltransferase
VDDGYIRDVYDLVADEYAKVFDDELDRKPFDRELLNAFAERMRGQGPVLEIGCGPGHVARYLHERDVHVSGLDLSQRMVEIARKRNPAIEFSIGDMAWLELDDDSLAGVVAFYSLIHIPRASVLDVLRELRRVIRSGGTLLVAVHGGDGTARNDEFLGYPVAIEATLFGLEEISELVERAGFLVDDAAVRAPYDFEYPTDRLYVVALG